MFHRASLQSLDICSFPYSDQPSSSSHIPYLWACLWLLCSCKFLHIKVESKNIKLLGLRRYSPITLYKGCAIPGSPSSSLMILLCSSFIVEEKSVALSCMSLIVSKDEHIKHPTATLARYLTLSSNAELQPLTFFFICLKEQNKRQYLFYKSFFKKVILLEQIGRPNLESSGWWTAWPLAV